MKIEELYNELSQVKHVKYLMLNNCSIQTLNNETLPPIPTLTCIIFINCNDNIFKAFAKQEKLQQIAVCIDKLTNTGFPHGVFKEICMNCKNLDHLVVKGDGTRSFFESNEFLFKVRKLETSMITFNWFVGLQKPRLKFIESQIGSLKDLTIDQLPFDFDGGHVLKYIIEGMNLNQFYYGSIPLIVDGYKQKEVKEFEASEIQITSAIEMTKQFKCHKFILKLSNTEISSDAIEKFIDAQNYFFDDIREFVVIDNSCGSFGVFLGFYKKLRFLQKLTFRTKDRCINSILKELPLMFRLEEIQLTSTAPRASERYQTIKVFAPNLKIIRVDDNSVQEAQGHFRDNVEVAAVNEANALGSVNAQRVNEDAELRKNRGRDDDDDDEDEENNDGCKKRI